MGAGVSTPRGPVITFEVLAAVAVGLVVGGVSGVAMQSRRAMLLASMPGVRLARRAHMALGRLRAPRHALRGGLVAVAIYARAL